MVEFDKLHVRRRLIVRTFPQKINTFFISLVAVTSLLILTPFSSNRNSSSNSPCSKDQVVKFGIKTSPSQSSVTSSEVTSPKAVPISNDFASGASNSVAFGTAAAIEALSFEQMSCGGTPNQLLLTALAKSFFSSSPNKLDSALPKIVDDGDADAEVKDEGVGGGSQPFSVPSRCSSSLTIRSDLMNTSDLNRSISEDHGYTLPPSSHPKSASQIPSSSSSSLLPRTFASPSTMRTNSSSSSFFTYLSPSVSLPSNPLSSSSSNPHSSSSSNPPSYSNTLSSSNPQSSSSASPLHRRHMNAPSGLREQIQPESAEISISSERSFSATKMLSLSAMKASAEDGPTRIVFSGVSPGIRGVQGGASPGVKRRLSSSERQMTPKPRTLHF